MKLAVDLVARRLYELRHPLAIRPLMGKSLTPSQARRLKRIEDAIDVIEAWEYQ